MGAVVFLGSSMVIHGGYNMSALQQASLLILDLYSAWFTMAKDPKGYYPSLYMEERTGSLVCSELWSYVLKLWSEGRG